MTRPIFAAAAAALLVCLAAAASADEVRFKNGDRLTGKITSAEGGKLKITSKVAGDVTVGGTVTLSITVSCVLKSTSSGQATIRISDTQFPSHLVGSFPSIDVSGDGPQTVTIQGSFTVPAGLPSI